MKGLSDDEMLLFAAGIALRKDDRRSFRLGAVGLRNDGTLVSSSNGPAPDRCSQVHAEVRLSQKLTPDSIVWVSRVRHDGSLGMARPCPTCSRRLNSAGVTRVVYTINDNEHGVISMSHGTEIHRPSRGARARRNLA